MSIVHRPLLLFGFLRRLPEFADLPTHLALLGPELDRFLTRDLLAALQQGRLARDQLAPGELQRLRDVLLADRLEVQHLAAIAQPAVLR